MIEEYLNAGMRLAKYKLLEDNSFYASILEAPGVWANAETLEDCRDELREVLEDWVLLGVARGHEIPVFSGFSLPNFQILEEVL
jgi:predicted RNase H-like HicB family nuclease